MYKTYIETKHENHDRLGSSKMGKAGYLLTRPRRPNTNYDFYLESYYLSSYHLRTSVEFNSFFFFFFFFFFA